MAVTLCSFDEQSKDVVLSPLMHVQSQTKAFCGLMPLYAVYICCCHRTDVRFKSIHTKSQTAAIFAK